MRNPFRRKFCIREGIFADADDKINGYTHAELCSLITPILGIDPESECALGVVIIYHDSSGKHVLRFFADTTAEMANHMFWMAAYQADKAAEKGK